jgi:alpha-terpineol hydroxylase
VSVETTARIPVIPDDVARAAVLPESYRTGTEFWGAYRWLRENMPVGEARLEGFDPLVLITKHADIVAVERDGELFHACREEHDNPILQDRANDAFQRSLNDGSIRVIDDVTYMGPEEHARVRGAAHRWFLPPAIRVYEEQIREMAKAAVDDLMAGDGECDFVKDFARFFPLHVIMTMLGVPPEDEPRMLKLTQEFFGTHDPDEQREEVKLDPAAAAKMWHAATEDFNNYFQQLAEDKRAHPEENLGSYIANSELDGKPLDVTKQNGWYLAIAAAGHDTTSSTLAGGMLALIENPDQLAIAQGNPELISGLVDESLRWTSPVRHFMRTATGDTELRGQQLRAGDRLMLLYASANRDEDVFANPESFDITRKPNRHLAFGFGPHVCIGQFITKLELRILWAELLPHLRSVELAGEPKHVQTNFVGGLKSLPIRFEKA